MFFQNNQVSMVGIDLSKKLGIEKVKNVFANIEEACLNEKVLFFLLISSNFQIGIFFNLY